MLSLKKSAAFLMAHLVKNLPEIQETLYSIPGLGRSPGEGMGYPLQYSWASDQIANISWSVEKATEFQKKKKKIYFCFTDYAKAFDCVDLNKLENS